VSAEASRAGAAIPTDVDAGSDLSDRTTTPASGDDEPPRVIATPLVRRLAREHAIDLGRVTGTGPGGRIIRVDLDHALSPQPSTPGVADAVPDDRLPRPDAPVSLEDVRQSTVVPFDKTRQVISRRLSESSSTTPHFSVTAVADVDALLNLRADINGQRDSSGRAKISVNDLLVRACALALREHPEVNASYSPQGNGATLLHGHVNIGIAVAAATGLVVPVVTHADQKSASHIAAESRRLTGLAKERKLTTADMTGGTFTISNLGMFGVEQFTAIINQPEGAILAVGAARPEPVVVDGAVEVRHRMRFTLSADHRIIDGALAARFLATLTALLERPLTIIV
jgi:pyruvate dehydrogenase E2 component (dihydrolipoamide acetyltransferase)